jgi:hypothetical protein
MSASLTGRVEIDLEIGYSDEEIQRGKIVSFTGE